MTTTLHFPTPPSEGWRCVDCRCINAAHEAFCYRCGAGPCSHESASGVDQVPLTDPAKIWRCHTCGVEYTAAAS